MRFLLPFSILLLSHCVLNPKKGADAEAVIDFYKSQKNGVEDCFQKISKSSGKKIVGDVTLSWKVTLHGRAQDIKIERSSVANSELEACLVQHLESLEFPKQTRFHPAQVEHNWSFGTHN